MKSHPFTSASLHPSADWLSCACCGRADCLRLLHRFHQAEIVGCTRCACAFTVPEEVVDIADFQAASTLSEEYRQREAHYRRQATQRVRTVRRSVRAGRLLDIGCSVGLLVEEAARAGFDATGVDTDGAAVAAGRAAGRNVSEAAEGAFDVVTLVHVLEHLREPQAFLAEWRARLAPGGHLFVWTPNYAGLLPRTLPALWYGWQPRQHYRHYSPASLCRLAEAAGFTVERVATGSMAHAFTRQARWQDTLKYTLCWSLAHVGRWLGQGDEVLLIARVL